MFIAYRAKDDVNLTLITIFGQFPRHFEEKNWELEAVKADVTADIAEDVTQAGFLLIRSNRPVGERTTYGLMP